MASYFFPPASDSRMPPPFFILLPVQSLTSHDDRTEPHHALMFDGFLSSGSYIRSKSGRYLWLEQH